MQAFFETYHLPWLLKASCQAAVLILLVLAVQWAFGRRLSPRWRYGLWLLVVARLALPWTMPSSVSVFNLLNLPNASAAVARLRATPEPQGPLAPSAAAVPAARLREAVPGTPATTATGFSVRLSHLLLVWAAGAVALAACLVFTHYRLARKVTPCRPLIDARLLNLLEDCKQAMGLRVPVTLVETTAVGSPSLFGFVRPRLLLPVGLTRSFSQEELRYVFLHELSHIKRQDILTGWLMTALQILHWFNPLVWLAFHRMRVDRELACDALALSYAKDEENQPYGRTIIKLLEGFGCSTWAPSMAGTVENKNQMKERISMIAKFRKTSHGPALAGVLFIALGLVTLTDAQTGGKRSAQGSADAKWNLQEKLKMAEAGNQWAAYDLWDAYARGNHGVQPDPVQADKWLGELVQNVWVVRFEPIDDFAPKSPGEFLEHINQNASSYSGRTNIGAASFFRTTKQGNKLAASFLSNYPDQLKASLGKVPGLKVTSVERITPKEFIKYEQSPQESLLNDAGSEWNLQEKLKMAEAGNQWAAYDLWDSYYRGNHGVPPDPAQANKWLGKLVQDVWVVRFEPVKDFAPTNPGEFLEHINQNASSYSGRTNIGAASFFRTTKQGDKLVGSFLSNYPDQLKTNLAKVPGLKVTSAERITPEEFIKYEQSPQESLSQEAASGPAPRIVATSPAVATTDVDPGLTEITVTFDQDMGGGMSWTGGGPEFPPSPEGQKAQWRDKRTCVLPVKLEAAHFYRVGINSKSYQNFSSSHGLAALPSAIYFTTQGASDELKAMTLVPQVVKLDPFNGAQNVSPAVTELRVTFSVPMGGGCSWCTVSDDGADYPKGPEGKRVYWTEDKKTCVLPVELKPGMTYRLSLNAPEFKNFQSAGGVPLEPVEYTFKTSAN